MDANNIDDYEIPPVGKPIANTNIFILDEDMNLCPVGVFGNLFIEGGGAMLGYINNPDLTAQKFIPSTIHTGKTFYKTGDIGRWLSDGNIEYRGRKDKQLKIRGFRVEPGEIETLIMASKGVQNCVIIDKEDHLNQKYLLAYIVTEDDYDQFLLEKSLAKRFPSYMIPKLVVLNSIPLMPNGKVDRDSLPEPEISFNEHVDEFIEASTETEKLFASIWKKLLKVDKISASSDFFELGGHSLRASQMLSEISRELNITLNLAQIFQNSKLTNLAKLIDTSQSSQENQDIPVIKGQDYYPVSPNQLGIWFNSQSESGNKSYNFSGNFLFIGKFEFKMFKKALHNLIKRHESLRSNFYSVNGQLFTKIHEKPMTDIFFEDLTNSRDKRDLAISKAKSESERPFDLENDALVRVSIYKLDEDEHAMLYTLHHIITDGWSMGIFVRELLHFYNIQNGIIENRLEELKIQNKDVISWKHDKNQGKYGQNARDYWLRKLGGELKQIDFPTDFNRPNEKTYISDHLSFEFDLELSKKMRLISSSENVSLFVLILSALKILISKYTNCRETRIGTAVSGRNHRDLEDQIGLFVNTIVLRDFINDEFTFLNLLKEVKETVLMAYEYQDYPFIKILGDLSYNIERDKSALYDFTIVSHNMDLYTESKDDISQLNKSLKVSQFFQNDLKSHDDMTFHIWDEESSVIKFDIAYNVDLFASESIELFFNRLNYVLQQVCDNRSTRVSEICIDKELENSQLTFNLNFEAD
jgi:acyl carrier protein